MSKQKTYTAKHLTSIFAYSVWLWVTVVSVYGESEKNPAVFS